MEKHPPRIQKVPQRPAQHGQPINRGNFKLLVDPQLKKGQQKLVRFNGDSYSSENHGQAPLVVRDPRPRTSRLWSRRERVDLPVPRYKIDEWYIGAIPPREITFSKLNDNVTKQFMEQLCSKFGKLERVRVYYHPKTNKHMGLAKVVFSSIKSATQCIESIHETSIMGNIISAVIDSKGDLLKRLHHKIMKGELIAETMPDVIRHTQEKPVPRPSERSERRKSSQDDPRRRQSTDSINDHLAIDHSKSLTSGPQTPKADLHPSQEPPTLQPDPDHFHHSNSITEDGPDKEREFMSHDSMEPDPAFMPREHEHNSDSFQKPLQKVPPLQIPPQPLFAARNQVNAQSLESGYGSHPGSANLVADQGSPVLANVSDGEVPGSTLFEGSKNSADSIDFKMKESVDTHKKHKKKHKKRKKRDGHRHDHSDNNSEPEVVGKPMWSKDLENRIDTMLSEQNQKFNLKDTRRKDKSGLSRRYSEASFVSDTDDRHPQSNLQRKHSSEHNVERLISVDREDGECSGEEQGSDHSTAPTDTLSSKPVTHPNTESEQGEISPELIPDIDSRTRFSRSPSPRAKFPPPPFERVPPPHNFERHPELHRQRSPDRHPDSLRFGRFHHQASPPRRSPIYREHHPFHPDRLDHRHFEHHRRRSPSFETHRRGRSPGFDHRHHRNHSPFRGRPPSPGFLRRQEIPPDHPDFHRRGPNHHRRSMSPPPRRHGSPEMHRMFDSRREHFMHRRHSPPRLDKHRRGPSPPMLDGQRRDRHSPIYHRDGFRHISPEIRRQRDSDLPPPELLERWTRHRSPSPASSRGTHPHARIERHFMDKDLQRPRYPSPHGRPISPRRMMSPSRISHDEKPYSPGDLTLEDSSQTDGPDLITSSAPTDYVESDSAPVAIKPPQRIQRQSSDQDPPQLSLDERLREITGEPPPEPETIPSEQEDVEDDAFVYPNGVLKCNLVQKSPSGSLDMEISSGHSGGGSPRMLPGDPNAINPAGMHQPFRVDSFPPRFPAPPPHQRGWNFGQVGWNGFDHRMQMPGQQMMWGHGRPGFHPDQIPHLSNGFPHHPNFLPAGGPPGSNHQFDPKVLPPPPPGWNRPWVEAGQPMHPGVPGAGFIPPSDSALDNEESQNNFISNCVLNRISAELKDIIKRDLDRKVIETMAFKVYESWWDSQSQAKVAKPATAAIAVAKPTVKTEAKDEADKENLDKISAPSQKPSSKLPALLNTFDPLNWAKGSLEMDGFRIGLGLRSAISKMPSFRVKKRTPSPPPFTTKKMKIEEKNKAKIEESKLKKKKGQFEQRGRKRRVLDSGGEDDEESEVESSEDEEDKKSRVPLDVDDVFSSSASSSSEDEEEEASEDEEDESEAERDSDLEETDKEDAAPTKNQMKFEKPDEQLRAVKRPSEKDSDDLVQPLKKRIKSEGDKNLLDEVKSDENVTKADMLSPKLTSPLLPPSAPVGADLTPQNLKHVHPKKRYRALSKEETRNLSLIAEVSGRLRSDDEISAMSDKEKAALEVLTDMKLTPERRHSSATRLSESSESSEQPTHPSTPGGHLGASGDGVFSPPVTPLVPRRASSASDTLQLLNNSGQPIPATPGSSRRIGSAEDSRKSGSEELEAVEALLSIKQSQPPLPPLSPSPRKPDKKLRKKGVKSAQLEEPATPMRPRFTAQERQRVLDIAEEHCYFRLLPSDDRKQVQLSAAERISDEHSYSYPPSSLIAQVPPDPHLISMFDTDVTPWSDFSNAEISSASAAERVKLRRESKDTKKPRSKSRARLEPPSRSDERKASAVRFRRRSDHQEMSILYLMWATGLDLEDMKLLRAEYEDMLTQSSTPQWVNETHWVPHPVTQVPDTDPDEPTWFWEKKARSRRKKKSDPAVSKQHKTGCSRSEGYYKLTDKSKLIQRRLMYRQADNAIKPGSRRGIESSTTPGLAATEKSREARHMMRRIASEFGSDVSDLLKYNQLMFRKKSVKFARSSIHGWGLFAQETVAADEMVIEYVGELVRSSVADRREVVYTKRGIGSSYLFRIDSDHIIDATKCGNYARFMNHSCNPSCYAKVITVDGAKKIVIYSKDVIKPQDEITYDYKFPLEDVKIPCFCGAVNCRGTLN